VESEKLLPCLQQMLDGFRKDDPPMKKQLPVEADVPELLVSLGLASEARKLDWSIGDFTMITFYHLLRIGKYTTKGAWNNTKQTQEFKLGDITFFAKDKQGNLCCLPRDAPLEEIKAVDGATMKLDNQKNGWKGVCVYQESKGDPTHCPVWALSQRYLHLCKSGASQKTVISAYFHNGKWLDVTSDNLWNILL
jgi:hypothetical protein